MPPTVAQTAPAFADAAGERVPVAILAYRAEYEDRSVVLSKLPPEAQDFFDEPHGYKNFAARVIFQQLDDDWTRCLLLPPAPSAFEDWSWSLPTQAGKDFSRLVVKPFDAEPIDFARPIVTPLAYDENALPRRFEWLYGPQTAEQDLPSLPLNAPRAFEDGEGSRDYNEKRFWLERDVLLGVPFVPASGWLDENPAFVLAGSGSLAAMVSLDEFVNAPSSGNIFGSTPGGRSARFGFSIPAFR